MIEYLLDTNVLAALTRQPKGKIAERIRHLPLSALGVSLVTAAEARFGYVKKASRRLERDVEQVLGALTILPLEPPVDEMYAQIRARLERAGTPIGTNDLWIAAHALALGCTLVTANEREFRRVPGLRVENWFRPADI